MSAPSTVLFPRTWRILQSTLRRQWIWSTANAATRERSNKLYGLLAGLLKGRALQTLRAVGNSNGYEAWRQLLLTLRPTNKNRGLALLSAVMGWPSFQMGQAIQPQLLKLEDAFEEARRASVTLQDEIKVAVVLRCISGQLRTHVSLQLNEGMSYAELRECLMKWDRAQQKWSHLVNTQEAVAMEIDRIEGKGDKGKSKGKGKGKYDKGKGKGKKVTDLRKGKERASGKEVPFLKRAKEDGVKTKVLGNQKEKTNAFVGSVELRGTLLVTVFVKFQKLHKFSNFFKYQYQVANQVLELRQSVESLRFPLPLCQQELHVSPGRGAMLNIYAEHSVPLT